MKQKKCLSLALVLCLLLGGAGCAMFADEGESVSTGFDTPAQVLANEAETLYREGEFEEAAELYKSLMDRYPYSRYKLLAELRLGDAYLEAGSYSEAEVAYEDFVRLHPQNEAVPYALYKLGLVYHSQMQTPDRDPSPALKAEKTFKRLLEDYPKDEHAIKALPRLAEAQKNLAGHDLFVGKFYMRIKRYRAAAGRLRRVITEYPDVGLYNEAMHYLVQAKAKIAITPEEERRRADRRDLYDRVDALDRPDTDDPMLEEIEAGNPTTD
jgi:outer membrane protein assembly factor BamD